MFNKTAILTIVIFAYAFNLSAVFGQDLQSPPLSSAGLPTIRPPATISISENGVVKVQNLVVFQIAGSTFFARTYWDEAYVRWTMRTASSTQVIKKYGGVAKVSDIAVGHILNVDGSLLTGADSLNLNAAVIRDISLVVEDGSFSGKVTRANDGSGSFAMQTDSGLLLNVKVSRASIKKGMIYISLSKVAVGDKVLSVIGNYSPATRTIDASSVEIYQTQSLFAPRNFEGKLKTVSGTSLPTNLVVTVEGADYTVVLPLNAEILTAKKKRTGLGRFLIGDTVRFYGAIRPAEQTTIDAEIVRNLDL